MATNRSPIVGVFDDRAQAEKAIEELYNAGVSNDRISYSGRDNNPNTFVDNLKNLFGGGKTHSHSAEVVNDLEHMGISEDEAQYYAQEYEAGRTIIAVQADEQTTNTMNILRSNGAHDFTTRSNYDKIGGANQGKYDTGTSQTSAGAMAQRTDDSPTRGQPDRDMTTNRSDAPSSGAAASTFPNQPANAFDPRSTTSDQSSRSYDTGATTSNQPASSYDQSAGSMSNQQQTDYNRNANIGNQPASGYDQGAAFAKTADTQQQPGYGNAPRKDQPTSTYDQSTTMSSSGYRQEPGFAQAPNKQNYTTPDAYQQTTGQTGQSMSQDPTNPNAYGQQGQSSSQDPTNPNAYGQQSQQSGMAGQQRRDSFSQDPTNASTYSDPNARSNRDDTAAPGTYDQQVNRSTDPAFSQRGNASGNYGQNTDPNMYRDPNAGTYSDPNAPGTTNRTTDPDAYGRNKDTTDTSNPLKKMVNRLKGETDPDEDYDRERRNTDPNQNI